MIAAVLEMDRQPDPEQTFADLGVDSILSSQIARRINARFGSEIAPTDFYRYATPLEMATYLESQVAATPAPTAPAPPPVVNPVISPARINPSLGSGAAAALTSGAPVSMASGTPQVATPQTPAGTAPDRTGTEAIAVIGLSCRFPGARNADEFWDVLRSGQTPFSDLAERWGIASDRPLQGGLLPDALAFDPLFFRLSPREAAQMDPQQRVFLEEAWKAIEDAGYDPESLADTRCGVYVGAAHNFYGLDSQDTSDQHGSANHQPNAMAALGASMAILPARIAYHLNLKGPAIPVDTACSSSLVALHLACQGLLQGDCDLALAGGVALLLLSPRVHQFLDYSGMLSATNQCRPFDQSANGFVPAEGCGVVMLKRLSEAQRDGDAIYGVIRASGMNQDGRSNGITAPNVQAQSELEQALYTKGQIDPSTLSYVEAHGTGTKLGDPIELQALTKAFRHWTDAKQFCAIGSVKGNIGHAMAAAGMAGFIKVLLSLKHEALPASLHVQTPNPAFDWDQSPFYVPTQPQPWPRQGDRPRRAALSAFGFSGTNAHLVIEEGPAREPLPTSSFSLPWRVIPVSAQSRSALERNLAQLAAWADRHSAASLADVAWTLTFGRQHFDCRAVLVVQWTADLVTASPLRDPAAVPASLPHATQIREFLSGAAIAWSEVWEGPPGRRISLPAYAFERDICALTPPVAPALATPVTPAAPIEPTEPAPLASEPPIEDWLDRTLHRVEAQASQQGDPLAGWEMVFERLDNLGALGVLATFQQAGALREAHRPIAPAALQTLIQLSPDHQALFAGLLTILQNTGWLVEVAGELALNPDRPEGGASQLAATRSRLEAELRSQCPACRPYLDLLQLCLNHYPDLLAGRLAVTDLLYTPEVLPWVEAINRETPLATHFNGLVATAVATAVRDRAAQPGSAPIQILEIGAGTGATTASVLQALAPLDSQVTYHFTDLSPAFVQRGRNRWGEQFPFTRYAPLDIEADLASQGFAPGQFAIICAANVLHATRRIDHTLAQVHQLLAPGGLVILSEVCHFEVFATLTFGLTRGWWLFEDAPNRIPHSPLLTPLNWRRCLAAQGFPRVRTLGVRHPQSPETYLQSLIVAQRSPQSAAHAVSPSPDRVTHQVSDPLPSPAPDQLPNQLPQPSFQPVPAVPVSAQGGPDRCEQRVVALLANYLNVPADRLDPKRPFSDLGVDSIMAIELAKLLNAELAIELRSTDLFNYSTGQQLARHIEQAFPHWRQPAAPPIVTAPAPEAAPLPQAAAPPVSSPVTKPPGRQIAIIGMAGQFPGARNLAEFWQVIQRGQPVVGEVPPDRWDWRAIYDPDRLAPHKTPSRHGGFLDDVGAFDPALFQISPREAEFMDPQQRLLLMETWAALEDAGYPQQRLDGSRTGVFVGASSGDYWELLLESGLPVDGYTFTGNAGAMLPARIAYWLNLKGPTLAIDSACSSSLIAVHTACESIEQGHCDLAIAGGVSVLATPRLHLLLGKVGMLSPTGTCKPFDHSADGIVISEGVGVVILKPLDRALADGDRIHAVIQGSGTNQDGKTSSLTAPSGPAQTTLIQEVYQRFDLDPRSIGYVETHGTGTPLGDPIELHALSDALRAAALPPASIPIGSVKGVIGHSLTAAGIASLLKVVLALKHRSLPPCPLSTGLNGHIQLDASPLRLDPYGSPWTRPRA